jgi:hypothetical protein
MLWPYSIRCTLIQLQPRESSEIGTNPYHPIPFDTLTKKVFHNFLYLLYFGTDHLDHLTPEDWLNVKWLSTDWYFPRITANIVQKLVTIRRRLVPPPLQIMGNSLPVYRVFDKQEQCYDFEQCIWTKPVLVFGTEQSSIVNSRRLSLIVPQRSSSSSEFGEHLKECHCEVVLS